MGLGIGLCVEGGEEESRPAPAGWGGGVIGFGRRGKGGGGRGAATLSQRAAATTAETRWEGARAGTAKAACTNHRAGGIRMPFNRSVDDVLETIRNAKVRERGISVLVGAGCSVTAGIPIAADIVAQIEKRYPVKYARAEEKTYPKCMAELGSDERRGLIAEYVDKARINWAHVAIATLVKGGYIDRVLTTNFDPLVVRACALLNEFPAVYDFAVSSLFKGADIPGNAIFYLNGQRTGFVHIHTADVLRLTQFCSPPYFEGAERCSLKAL